MRIRTLDILDQFESGFKLQQLFSHPRLTFQPQLPNPVLMADKSPSTQRRATRTMNVDQHPGLAIPVRKRHTKAEMAQDKALQEEKKSQKKHQQMKGIACIAELEDRMAVDNARARTAHPQNEKGSFSCTFLNY